MWHSYSTDPVSGRPRQQPSDQVNAPWSTTRDEPCTPPGWKAERGSGRGGPPSRLNA